MAVRDFKDTTGGFLGLGNFNKFRGDPFGFLLDLAEEQGDVAFFRLGPMIDMYLVTNPDYIRELLVKHWELTVKWKRMANAIGAVAPHILSNLEGDTWRKHRKLLTPAFHTQRIQAYLELMNRHADNMVQSWSDGQVHEMVKHMTTTTMGIIGEILFDISDIEGDAAELSRALDVLLAQIVIDSGSLMVLPKWLPIDRHKQEREARDHFYTYLNTLIQNRRAEGVDHGDVLSALIDAQDADTGETLTDDMIRDELYGLFLAGHETTSVWVTWALYALAKYPQYQIELHREVMAVVGDNDITLEMLGQLPYMHKVLNETLRKFPPAWSLLFREAADDIALGDGSVVIPKGGVIYISPYVQHHLPQYWDDPDRFDPSRFDDGWKDKLPGYVYMPFSGGPRVCLGSHMADMEAKVILATIIKNYSVEIADPDQQVWMNGMFTLRPYPNMPLRVRKRE